MTLGVGTLAYGLAAGALGATALVFGMIAMQRRRSERQLLALAWFGLAMAVSTVATVRLHKSNSVDEYADLLKLYGAVGLIVMIALVWLVASWTAAVPRPALVVFLVASGVVAVLQLALPEGLLSSDITGLRQVQLLGEPFVVHEGSRSPWRPVLDLYLLGSMLLIVAALWTSFRRGPRAEAVVLAAGISVVLVAAAYDGLVDEGLVDTPYLAPFGAVVVVLVAAWHLARRVAVAERSLAKQATDLEATVIDRTAALIASKRRLEEQLAQQREAARRLAALAVQFESVNSLALDHDDLDELKDELRRVLANLGDLLGVGSVRLRVDGIEGSTAWPLEVKWSDDRFGDHEPDAGGVATDVEPLVMGTRSLGELVVQSIEGQTLGADERRYIELTADHLAGFVKRLELSDRIAATAVDAERHRIARELHDSVTQKLYSIAFLADAVPRQLDDEPDRAAETVHRMRELLLSSLAELRTLLFELQPDALDAAGLPQLIEQLAEMFANTGRCHIEHDVDAVPSLPPAVKLAFYRVAQESLSNATRHSESAVVQIELSNPGGVVHLVIRDQGIGGAEGAEQRGQGMRNMRDRAASAGADLDIDSVAGAGTSVTLRWATGVDEPLTAPDHSRAEEVAG